MIYLTFGIVLFHTDVSCHGRLVFFERASHLAYRRCTVASLLNWYSSERVVLRQYTTKQMFARRK